MKLKDIKPFQLFKIGKRQYLALDWEPKVLIGVKRILRSGISDKQYGDNCDGEHFRDAETEITPIDASDLETTLDVKSWIALLQKRRAEKLKRSENLSES